MAIKQDDNIKNKQEDFFLSDIFLKAQKEQIEFVGREKFFNLRDRSSDWLISCMTFLIVTHIVMAFFIGWQWLDFQHYPWLMPILILENFLEITGMGYIVVKFLYPPSN